MQQLNLELQSLPGVSSGKIQIEKQSDENLFDALITNKRLNKTVKKLYQDGHHARAVEEAYKFLDNIVKKIIWCE